MEICYFLLDLVKKKNNGSGNLPLQPGVFIPESLEEKILYENDKEWLPCNEFLYPTIEQIFPSVNYSSYLQV